MLAARKRRFDAATAAISAHIARVSALTEKVKAGGGDVSKVEASLAAATAALDSAKSIEAQVAEELKAVPGSANPKAGLAAARADGRKAVAELKVARSKVIEAVHELRAVVQRMEDSGETSESLVGGQTLPTRQTAPRRAHRARRR